MSTLPKVVIELDSTGVVSATSTVPVDLIVLNLDYDEETEKTVTVDGIQAAYYRVEVGTDTEDYCEFVFREVETMEETNQPE